MNRRNSNAVTSKSDIGDELKRFSDAIRTRGAKRERQTLRFDEVVSIREVQSCSSLIHNEHTSLWWTAEELNHIRRNLQKIVYTVNSRGISRTNGQKYCIRGLERFLDSRNDRNEAKEFVLREQAHQRLYGYFDPMPIAAMYGRIARKSSIRATFRGSKDADITRSFRSNFRNKHLNQIRSTSKRNRANLYGENNEFWFIDSTLIPVV